MVRKTLTITVILVILFSASPSGAYMPEQPPGTSSFEIARNTFSLSGAELGEIKLQAWGQITNKEHSLGRLQEVFAVIAKGLGLGKKPEIQIEKDLFISISLFETDASQEIQLVLQSVPDTLDTGISYLGFLLITQDMEIAKKAYYLLLPLLGEIGYTDELGITISGTIPKDLSQQRQTTLIKEMALGCQGEFVEGISGELISSAFYTPRLNKHLRVNGKKVNLQLASRCYQSEMTKIYVGVPMIYQDY